MTNPSSLVIVYQFGKVASTAIVRALEKLPDIEVHQSHFLGEDALRKSITNAANPRLEPYFRKHMIGQLTANLELTHRMNRIIEGLDTTKLCVLTLSREPIDWLRSCIQQDIEGHRDAILAVSASEQPETPSVEHGLSEILDGLADFIDAKGGIAPAMASFQRPGKQAFFNDPILQRGEIYRRILMLVFRPLLWFEDHFHVCFGHGLNDFQAHGRHWIKDTDTATFVMLRYEDIASELVNALASANIQMETSLPVANSSREKPYADEIQAAFSGAGAKRLRAQVLRSEYAEFFGYGDRSASVAA